MVRVSICIRIEVVFGNQRIFPEIFSRKFSHCHKNYVVDHVHIFSLLAELYDVARSCCSGVIEGRTLEWETYQKANAKFVDAIMKVGYAAIICMHAHEDTYCRFCMMTIWFGFMIITLCW